MLENYPKEAVLKDGEKIILRPMVKEDEQKLLAFFSRLSEKDRLFLRDNVTDPRVIKSWVDNLDYEHVLPILAEIDDRIIGDATLHRITTDEPQKIGEIRIVTDRDFRRRGLGKLLAREIYFLALRMHMNRLVAEIVEDQRQVIETFRKLGFRHEEMVEDRAVDLYGARHNLVVMTEDVDALWKTIEDQIARDTAHYSRH